MKPITKDFGIVVLMVLILLWGFTASIERLVFFNTNLYPDFLVNKTVSLDSKEAIYELIKQSCVIQHAKGTVDQQLMEPPKTAKNTLSNTSIFLKL